MTKRFPWFCGFLFVSLAWAAGQRTTNDPAQEGKPYVLLVGIDGFRYDYAERYGARNLLTLRNQGSSSEAIVPQFPSLTFPNFYSMATGLLPEHHGIVANRFWDPARRAEFDFHHTGEDGSWYEGTPIWELTQQQGMLTAAYFWPGTGAEIDHTRPTYYFPLRC